MGTLYVVGTPIGNLEDITRRALRVLREVDLIACEDTRQTRKLLARYGIETPLVSYHEHNERARAPQLIRRLAAGHDIALVSDAGMPGVSDPGYHLITQAIEAGIPVVAVPGPSAVTGALSVAGVRAERFVFLGFLPRTPAAMRRTLEAVATVPAALVLFEAPHRVQRTLAAVAEVLGPRRLALVRELTKVHEEILRGTPEEVAAILRAREPRGEMTLVIEAPAQAHPVGASTRTAQPSEIDRVLRELLAGGASRRDAARTLAARFGLPHRTAYSLVVRAGRP